MDNYPDIDKVHSSIKRLPKWRIIKTAELAKEAGLAKAANTVMIGAASSYLPIKGQTLEKTIAETFAEKDPGAVAANTKAFKLGQTAAKAS
jgi:indolepyruvate ferredoxin oxidoreductase beta subunit